MGWFNDVTGLDTGQFLKYTAMGADPAGLSTMAAGQKVLSNALSTPKDPTAVALNRGVDYGVGALRDIAFDEQGNLIVPEYRAPGALTQQAVSGMAARAANDPMQALSEKYYTEALGGGPNPYLDAAYKQAAGKVRADLSSQFERAGRYGGTDMALAMGESLGNLATNIYGGAYESDMARRERAAQLAPTAGFAGLQRQYAAGQLQDEMARAPEDWDYERGMQAVNDYLATLGVAKGGYVPVTQRNKTAEALGLLTGVGSILGGPIGGMMGIGATGANLANAAAVPQAGDAQWYRPDYSGFIY